MKRKRLTPARIAVLGGGPAGGSAALSLARSGAAVDLYLPERPGEKPCGGAVPEHVLPRLAGFDPSPLPAVEGPQTLLENARGARLELDLRGVRIFRRADLDRAIVEAAASAGARLLRAKAERLEWNDGEMRVAAAGEVRTYDWVIGADGARGLTRRSLGLVPEGESVGLGASFRGLAWDRLVLAFPDVADAYLWIFPRPGGASVGIAWTPERLPDGAARAALDAFLDRHLPAGWRDLPGPRYRYPIPVFGAWTLKNVRRALARRVLLVGDAAALADPLTREGIRYGMLSGLWAAESLEEGEPESYPVRLDAGLTPEMERAAEARALFFDAAVGRWMVPVARRHRGVRRVLGDLLACRQPYQGLRRRLVRAAFGS
ncbi:MAG TPA: NAD(P)/FAD-dependent oxidoreductase [Thermoanaerobaculia bacterium]|nr:NAD(P)/FAD-dependent oxidoreductase [Thermoanaerobaculia bacterium]